ncbi:MAG: hypothetical protein L0H93_07945 [Nocardioides sp.]|nr:hypothetical protein [Nocardioides sp.]
MNSQPGPQPPRMGPPPAGGTSAEPPRWSTLTQMQWDHFLSDPDRQVLPEHTMWGSVLWAPSGNQVGFLVARPDQDVQVAHRGAAEITQRRFTQIMEGFPMPRSHRGWIGALAGFFGATAFAAMLGEPSMLGPALSVMSSGGYVLGSRWHRLTGSNRWLGYQWGDPGDQVVTQLHQIGRLLTEHHMEAPVYGAVRTALWEAHTPQSLAQALSGVEQALRALVAAEQSRTAAVDQGMQYLFDTPPETRAATTPGLDLLAELEDHVRLETEAHQQIADDYRRNDS